MKPFSFARLFVGILLGSFLGTLAGVGYVSSESHALLKAVTAPAGLQSASAVAITGGTITGITDLAVADGGTGASTAQAAAQNLGLPYKLAAWGAAVYMAPTGSMGNNGAVTLGTALDRIYTEGLWLYYPAGAVAAGVPASATFLWTVMSSTTAGTVFNSSFDGLSVPGVGTATAYSTTGPGAFTGVTTVVTAITVTVPANSMGATGQLISEVSVDQNAAAGTKTYGFHFNGTGGTDYGMAVTTQTPAALTRIVIRNQTTSIQTGHSEILWSGSNASGSGLKSGSGDTTGSTTLVFRFLNGTATNWMGIAGGNVFVTQ